jgi:hypothetical protein
MKQIQPNSTKYENEVKIRRDVHSWTISCIHQLRLSYYIKLLRNRTNHEDLTKKINEVNEMLNNKLSMH